MQQHTHTHIHIAHAICWAGYIMYVYIHALLTHNIHTHRLRMLFTGIKLMGLRFVHIHTCITHAYHTYTQIAHAIYWNQALGDPSKLDRKDEDGNCNNHF